MRAFLRVVLPVVLFVSTFCPAALHAGGADLSFSGGSGTPLTLTLAAPVTYTITGDFGGNQAGAPIYLLFEKVGNDDAAPFVSGDMTFSINGGPAHSLTLLRTGGVGGKIDTSDWYAISDAAKVNLGDTVVLNPGSLTTTSNFAAPPPPAGVYVTYIADTEYNRISTVSAPEPSTWLLMSAGVVTFMIVGRRGRARW